MWDIVQAAGWPIWFLLLASIIAVALIFERVRTLRDTLVLPAGVFETAKNSLQSGTDDALIQALAQQGSLGKVLSAGLIHVKGGASAMRDAMDDALYYESHVLNQYLPALGTIAAVAPLLGLFGTVIGMIETFSAQTPSGMNPAQLAHGISVALYNTAMGIFVAIVALLAYRLLRAKAERMMLQIESLSHKLIAVKERGSNGA